MESLDVLIAKALRDAMDERSSVASLVRQALHIARLRRDYVAFFVFQFELHDTRPPHFAFEGLNLTKEQFEGCWKMAKERHLKLRTLPNTADGRHANDPQVAMAGIARLERTVEHCRKSADHQLCSQHSSNAQVLGWADLTNLTEDYSTIVDRVRSYVCDFLSRNAAALSFGKRMGDVLDANRRFVEERLARLAPEILAQFNSAFKRAQEGDPEARSQALSSCRRILLNLANILYPPKKEPVIGLDEEERILSENKYVNRLCQYVVEARLGTHSRELLRRQIKELGDRLNALNDLASKGVHSEISEAEMIQCILQTYCTAGDLLRIEREAGSPQSVSGL